MNWSYSRYGTWKKCPAILRFQATSTEERVQHPAAFRGNLVHKIVEEYLLGKITVETMSREPLDLSYYTSFLDILREQGAKPELPLALDSSWNVVPWDYPDRWWRGILDCVIDFEDHVVIYDWKTGKEYPDHREQREIYAAAYFALRPVRQIKVFHTYLDDRKNTYTTFYEEDIPVLRKTWERRVEPMLADTVMAPNPGWHCRSCQFSRDKGGPCQF